MAGIGLILNPRAKRHAKDPGLADRLARVLDGDGVVRMPRSFDELRDVVEEFRTRDIQLVAVAGGDGTNHLTISGLVRCYGDEKMPYFAMLRGGTMNTVANSFGVPRHKPEVLLHKARRMYLRRAIQPIRFVEPNVMRVGPHSGFIFGTGAIHGFIAEYNSKPDRSPIWAAQVLGRACLSAVIGGGAIQRVARRWEGKITFPDGAAFPDRDYLLVGASTCGQIGLGFKPFYRSGEVPDRFHVLGIHTNPGHFIVGLPRVMQGRSLGAHRTYERLTDRFVLHPRGRTVPYVLDGDIYEHEGPLEVSCGPRLRIVIP